MDSQRRVAAEVLIGAGAALAALARIRGLAGLELAGLAFLVAASLLLVIQAPIGSVPIGYALMYGASFVARAFSAQRQVMNKIFQRAMEHKGFSFVQVMSPCVTFHDTYKTYKDITQPMPEGHDPSDRDGRAGLGGGTEWKGCASRRHRVLEGEPKRRAPVAAPGEGRSRLPHPVHC